ncbi:unnamed protein product [Rhodiola kirilowii]
MRELMKHVVRRTPVQVKPCEFCTSTEHKTDECPTLQTDVQADVNAVGNYQNFDNQPGPVKQYGAAAPNQGTWRNNNQQQQTFRQNTPGQYQQNAPNQYQQRGQNSNQPGLSNQGSSNKALEDMIKDLASAVIQDRATTKGDIEDLKKQMSQLTTTVSDLAASLHAGRLPSQTVQNPRGNVSQVEVVDTTFEDPTEELGTDQPDSVPEPQEDEMDSHSYAMVAPEGQTTDEAESETRMVVRHTQTDQMMRPSPTASHETPPRKSKDPGAFTVTCGIGAAQIPHCLIDLGAAINVMPYSLYYSLNLGPLKPPKLSIELGDRSCVRPTGLLEDLTLRVGDLAVPADFYVLQMENSRKGEPPGLILGRPFLYDTKTQINMDLGLLSLSFGGKEANFYVYEDASRPCTKKPPDIVHTTDYETLVPDPPEQSIQATRPAAMAKMATSSRGYKGKKPSESRRAEPSAQLDAHTGRTEGVAEQKYDLTRPWDPNL